MTTSMNERTHFFIRIYLSHFIRKGWCEVCVRGKLETGTHCYILTQCSSDHSSTSSAFWLGCSTVGPWGPQALSLQADSHAGILSPTDSNCNWNSNSNWLTQAVCGAWLYNCLTPTCFLCAYTSAPNSTTSTGQGDIPKSSTGCNCFAVLLLIYTGVSLDWRLGWGSICYNRSNQKHLLCEGERSKYNNKIVPWNFTRVERSLTIWQGQLGLKPRIPWQCSKP